MVAEAEKNIIVVVEITDNGEYTSAKAILEGQGLRPRIEGEGTSRRQMKAVSYALEDLAAKLRNNG